jgi:ribonuclease P protein component
MNAKATLRPHERLKDPEDFRRVFGGRRFGSDDVLVVYGIPNGFAHSRLGISVARKKVRAAHARNRLKRLVRETFRLNKAKLPSGIDFVVVPRAVNVTFAAVRHSLISLAGQVARRINKSRSSTADGRQ